MPRLAFVSPFLDKRHGTERRVVEWISYLADTYEIHIYSQRVEEVDLSKVAWHRIPKLPGPHLFDFIWWFAANHAWRWFDRQFRGLRYDLVFSPGANCLDADVVSVHILFSDYVREVRERLRLARNAPWAWPRVLHRRLYYSLAMYLERRVYRDPRKTLIVISRAAGASLEKLSGRGGFPVLYAGIDHKTFNTERCVALRQIARQKLELSQNQFALTSGGQRLAQQGSSCPAGSVGPLARFADPFIRSQSRRFIRLPGPRQREALGRPVAISSRRATILNSITQRRMLMPDRRFRMLMRCRPQKRWLAACP